MNHDMIELCYVMRYVQDYEGTLSTILVPPRSSNLGSCYEWFMNRSWCVYRILT